MKEYGNNFVYCCNFYLILYGIRMYVDLNYWFLFRLGEFFCSDKNCVKKWWYFDEVEKVKGCLVIFIVYFGLYFSLNEKLFYCKLLFLEGIMCVDEK